jgi:aromatic-L-amino-acid decarboxylase
MALRAFGQSGLESRIREHCRLARAFADRVAREPGFELAAEPSMGVVCFRCLGVSGDPGEIDQLNEAIVEQVNASGRAYLTHTRLRGRVAMRVGFGNVLTTEDHLGVLWSLVRAERDRLSGRAHLSTGAV